ncbi:MAG: tetratricopeptide repeat protein [Bryobacteraceae bacterium]|nr:tetratricopeptide repeat protein [Bryobacteraceae bacterium]
MTFVFALVAMAAPAAAPSCWESARMGRAEEARACFEKLAASRDLVDKAEALWGLGLKKEANDAFRMAHSASPTPAVKTRWGRLMLEGNNPGDARDLFNEALKINEKYAPAILGLALVSSETFERKAVALAEAAIKADPRLLEARELLASLLLEQGDQGEAAKAAEAALSDRPDALGAMSVLATIDLLNDRGGSPWFDKIQGLNPRCGECYRTVARHFVLNRRYPEAIALYRKALELNPGLHAARSELGVNLMRVGEAKEAQKQLAEAYDAGYRFATTSNSLQLLETLGKFRTFETPRAVLKLDPKEAGLLKPYLEREVERALSTYEKKYGFKLPGKVAVEVYPNHADFEVRTIGLPGLGALGVCFGLSVAMDSPSARTPGSFHWASTLWHELSHVYALTMTNFRVPRWFTEGLSVHEETAADPEWGDRLTPDILDAIDKKKLLPVAQLDRGFLRPETPGQVVVSYFQAGRICDYIQQKYGWEKLMAMMKAFAEVTTTASVVQNVLGVKPEEFDKEFDSWLRKQHETPLKNFAEWKTRMKAIHAEALPGGEPQLRKELVRLLEMYPEYVEGGNAYEQLAALEKKAGDKDAEREWLAKYMKQGGRNPDSLKRLAALEDERGEKAAAESVLRRVLGIYPMKDEGLHRKLASLRMDLKKYEGAVEEWGAVLATGTTDVAGAHYERARAYQALGRAEDAKIEVLSALEAAPGYRAAQKLLLELSKPKKEGSSQ